MPDQTCEAREAVLRLLAERGPDKTICPSEAARELSAGSDQWRDHMGAVHKAVDKLSEDGLIRLSWKGQPMDQRRGPYRIARRQP